MTEKVTIKQNILRVFMPFIIGSILSLILGIFLWKVFFFVFSTFGFIISVGNFLGSKSKDKDLSRRISITFIGLVFVVFFGFMQHENMQIEETVFYFAFFLTSGVFTRVLIHFCIAKVFGPLIWGRGFCGWACWTAAALEWLPINDNKCIPKQYSYFRVISLIVSLLIPIILITNGYDYLQKHIEGSSSLLIQTQKKVQFLWFIISNLIYYIIGIILAFVFNKKRAFCKIVCPVSLVMKAQTKISLLKVKPSGNKCIKCGICTKNCPMDIDVMQFISENKCINSSECIMCGLCKRVCPMGAIK